MSEFSDIREVAKPYSALELKTATDYQRGQQDAALLLEAKEGQSQAYNEGYAEEYAYQMSIQGRLREV